MGKGSKASKFWEVKGGKVVRTRKHCPKCGPGVYMAKHYDRMHCGKCKYTIWKKGKKGKKK